jgi:glycosyltransferase involved in cell wall biosynthesis
MRDLTIVIRNRNEAQYIGFAIQSVIDFFPNSKIIIIDNESTDDSLRIISLFKDILPIEIYKISDYSPGRSLNRAIQKVETEFLLILSAHAQIIKMDFDYVKFHLKDNVAVFGNQIPIYKGKKISKRYIWSHFGDSEVKNMFSNIENRYFLHNAFCFYKREILLNIPFDELLSGKEDRYWAIEIINRGMNYLYTPSVVVNHFFTENGATWQGVG